MRRFIFLMSMLTACVGYTLANEIVVSDVVIPKGGTATLDIQLNNEQVLSPVFEFYLRLPEGITVVNHSEKLGNRFDKSKVSVSCELNETRYWIMAMINQPFSQNDGPIPGEDGTIVTLELQANDDLNEGTVVFGTIEDPSCITWFADKNGDPVTIPSPVEFQISIGAPADTRLLLDETSTTAPEVATGVDVRVKRTINANEWSTICLPFAMSTAQCKAAFGDDVQLANFTSWSSEEDGAGDIVAINVGFTPVTAIEANHPYIIKVSSAIADFTVDGVNIAPEDEPTVQVGTKKAERGYMIGTYVANFTVPNEDLFLSGGKFWYSKGLTKMKAFRAYFEFADVLTSVEGADAPAFNITVGGETTNIKDIKSELSDDFYYNLGGQRVEAPVKGLYIQNGKKIIVK